LYANFNNQVKKGQKLYGILHRKCPRCHEGDLFTEPNPYRLKHIFDMPEKCPSCGQPYHLEPSFYYGAMYVNYAITVGIGVAVFVVMIALSRNWELYEYLIGITGVILLSAPVTFRLGRSIWINMFVKYDPHALEKAKGDQELSRTQ